MGFGIPLGAWFRGPLKAYWEDLVLSPKALARGYCHPDNSSKELDSKLIEAMTQEVVKSLTPEVVPGHR